VLQAKPAGETDTGNFVTYSLSLPVSADHLFTLPSFVHFELF